jgi:RNA polymerase sigma-70 factor (ECF subfamily)
MEHTAVVNRSVSDTSPADAVLVERAQRGDHAAFGQLVSRYQDRVYNTVYRMCHNHADALDLSQTAFLKAFQALPRFESRANFFTWLYRIAINLVITQRRSLGRRMAELDAREDGGTTLRLVSDVPGDDVDRNEQIARLTGALSRLDDEFRAAVVLKDIEDLDYATIGEILDVPVGTVKSRIHRGRAMLREMMGGVE